VAVIGGGLAGLACARTLADHGVEVTLFDKGRRPGGRTAAKRLGDGHYADHGAPCLDLDDARLAPWVKAWRQCGLLEPWTDSQGWTRLAAQPHGRGLAAHLAEDLDLRQAVAAAALTGGPGSWHVHSADGALEGPFERVVVAAPAPQTAALLQPVAPDLADRAATAAYASCMSAVASLPAPVSDAPAWGSYDDAVLAVAIRDSVKPGRPATQPETWVLHATTAWSAAHLDDDHEAIAQALWRAFVDRHAPTASPDALIGHRWRYARVTQPLGQDCLFDAERGIGACGDWCLGPDTGDALLSGFAMAGRLFAAEPAIEARGRPRQVRDAAGRAIRADDAFHARHLGPNVSAEAPAAGAERKPDMTVRNASLASLTAAAFLLSAAPDAWAGCTDAPAPGVEWVGCHKGGLRMSGVDLSGARIEKTDLSRSDMRSANLAGAVLTFSDLSLTRLADSILTGADLTKVDADRTDLSNADLTGATLAKIDLSRGDLSNARLIDADASKADFGRLVAPYSDWSRASLVKSDLGRADLSGAVLAGVDMTEADLGRAVLREADLRDAVLHQARLHMADLRGAKLDGASLKDALMGDTRIEGVDLRGVAGLTQAQLERSCGDADTQVPESLVHPNSWPCEDADA
jgi:predicted NAD/FAD-dependent oxidoreductase/uncharacterized protein YjbI with pentapeptide repeats